MLIEAAVQTRATWNQTRAIRETADAARQAAHDQEGAARQLATKPRAAARAAAVAKQAVREQYLAANDERKGWNERIRSLLTATQPVVGLALRTARPTSDPTILNTIIEQSNRVGTALIEATDVMIDQVGEPRTLASLGESLGRPAQAMLGQSELQALALQSTREAERLTVAANALGYGAVDNAMTSQAFHSRSLAQSAEFSPYLIKAAYSAPSARSLLAAFASRNESARATEWLEHTTWATSADRIRNHGMKVALSRDADDPKSANDFNPVDYLRTKGIVNPEDRHAGARLEGVHANGLWHPFIPAASERLGTGAEVDHAQQTSLERRFSSILRDGQAREAVRTMEAGADHASLARATIAAEAFTSLNGKTTIRERSAAIEDRQRADPREIIRQNREKLGAYAQPAILERVRAGGTRMPEVPAGGMKAASLPASEPLLGIFEPTRGAMGGSTGHRIDTDRLARALEMFTQGLERLTGMGRLAALGAGRAQIAPVPPALPAKPTPFTSRTDGSAAPF